MNLKNLTLASALVLAIPSLSLVSCSKKKHGVKVSVAVDNAKTAKTFNTDTTGKGASNGDHWKTGKTIDSLKSSAKDNANDASLSSVVVTYIDAKGKKQEAKPTVEGKDKFEQTFEVQEGSEISVSAKGNQAKVEKFDTTAVKPKNWAAKVKGKRADDAKVTLTIKIEKDGQEISGSKPVVGEVGKEVSGDAKATIKK